MPVNRALKVNNLHRPRRQGRLLHLYNILQPRQLADEPPSDGRKRVSVVIQNPDGRRRPDRMSIEVREHLLTPLESPIHEQHNCNGFVAQRRILVKSLLDGRSPMLPVVHNEPSRHGYPKGAQVPVLRLAQSLKRHLCIYRGGER